MKLKYYTFSEYDGYGFSFYKESYSRYLSYYEVSFRLPWQINLWGFGVGVYVRT